MVKKKGKSNRTSLKDKYKIQRRVVETNRKRRKQAKKDSQSGLVRNKRRDPGIPNSWPFKQDLLKDIQRAREKEQQRQLEAKEQRRDGLLQLQQHIESGGKARTIAELMAQAQQDRAAYEQSSNTTDTSTSTTDNAQDTASATPQGQQSRRAYLRELKKVVDTADVVLQVLDARDPLGTRIHPSVEDTILSRVDKKLVLVLNKIDLVPKEILTQWLGVLRRSHPTIAIKASSNANHSGKDDASMATMESTVPVGMEGLLQLLKNYARTSTGSKTTIVVGIVGYPNVGKSSIINALKRTRAVGVSSKPGFTTAMQEVVLDQNVRLLDSPGVVFDDRTALLGNCVHADALEDPVPAIEALLERCNQASLMMRYGIPAFPPNNAMMFLAMVAKSYGRVLKGGIPNKLGAARAVLRDWNSGKIPYYTAPPEHLLRQSGHQNSEATVVSSMAKEFDVTRYDEAVLNQMGDQDEMDFVQLEESKQGGNGKDGGSDEEAANEAVRYLTGKSTGESDDEMEEDDDGQAKRPGMVGVSRQQLAAAEDFF